ncbi:MAG: tetratricopeptide repeat protein [Candidatus Thermoplasmatota archaeon]|nr:tetratricopeptide repeat protein [Candidatus Thermoplasmatota archaeon]
MAEEEANALVRKAKFFASQGMHKEAIEHYRKALSICPNFAEAYNELGNVYLTQSNLEDAISCYRRAVLHKPFYTEAWNNQAAALLIQGIYDEAVKCYQKVVELEPRNANAWIAQGSLMLNLCRYSEALECFNKALELEPSSPEVIAKRKETIKRLEASKAKELKATKKICVLGDSMVGKTSLIRRYVYGMFVDKYLPTIGAKVTKKVISAFGVELTLNIWDITGLEDFKTIHPTYYLGANGALVVCDALRPETLERLSNWVHSLFKVTGRIPILILANKIDLARRFYQEDFIKRLASEFSTKYLLTSAKTGENVERAFLTIAEELVFK